MKKFIFIIAMLLPLSVAAQYAPYHPPVENLEYMTDYQWNNWSHGFMLNGKFVKNLIGLDLGVFKKYEEIKYPFTITRIGPANDSLVVEKDPMKTEQGYVSIGGFRCNHLTNYDSCGYSVWLMTLDQVREEYFPEVKGKVLYMINKFFIMDHDELYKISDQEIYKVEKVKSTDIRVLKDMPEFTVIRIFTRTARNMFPDKLGY